MRLINEEVHPVAHTPLATAFPWCCCCVKNWPKPLVPEKPKGSHGEALIENSAHKKGQSDADSDPILTYGFGINAYLNTMYELGLVFLLFSIISIPTFVFYMKETAYDYGEN
jgi:hypothetical protein